MAEISGNIYNLQAEINFVMGETKSTATFRILTKLLPGVDVILGKPWLRDAKPMIDFENGSIYLNILHALGPKSEIPPLSPPMESSPAAAILTLAAMLVNVVATATPVTQAGAVTTTTSGGVSIDFTEISAIR